MTEFFQTIMGKKFYEGTVPRIASALDRIANSLEFLANPNAGLPDGGN